MENFQRRVCHCNNDLQEVTEFSLYLIFVVASKKIFLYTLTKDALIPYQFCKVSECVS